MFVRTISFFLAHSFVRQDEIEKATILRTLYRRVNPTPQGNVVEQLTVSAPASFLTRFFFFPPPLLPCFSPSIFFQKVRNDRLVYGFKEALVTYIFGFLCLHTDTDVNVFFIIFRRRAHLQYQVLPYYIYGPKQAWGMYPTTRTVQLEGQSIIQNSCLSGPDDNRRSCDCFGPV